MTPREESRALRSVRKRDSVAFLISGREAGAGGEAHHSNIEKAPPRCGGDTRVKCARSAMQPPATAPPDQAELPEPTDLGLSERQLGRWLWHLVALGLGLRMTAYLLC